MHKLTLLVLIKILYSALELKLQKHAVFAFENLEHQNAKRSADDISERIILCGIFQSGRRAQVQYKSLMIHFRYLLLGKNASREQKIEYRNDSYDEY